LIVGEYDDNSSFWNAFFLSFEFRILFSFIDDIVLLWLEWKSVLQLKWIL